MSSTSNVPFQVKRHDILSSNTNHYQVLDFMGEGCFGKVAKCSNVFTGQTVAVKIHKDSKDYTIQKELAMLEAIGALDPDKNNIVRFIENFTFKGLSCLAFEMLDMSLWDLVNKDGGLSLSEIRSVTQQLLVAFEALKGMGIMHTDLKPDNIMLVNHKDQPFKIKLIDFGLARPVSKVKIGTMMQACGYRAPEVSLGLPLSEAVDMWGVGCVMAYLYFGIHLFPVNCPYNYMKAMVHLLGLPSDEQLMDRKHSLRYFNWNPLSGWGLRTPEEYEEITGDKAEVTSRYFDMFSNLEDAVMRSQAYQDRFEYRDMIQFLSLLKSCLHLDPEQRITPTEALNHDFITMAHLENGMGNEYVDAAFKSMADSHLHNFDQSNDFTDKNNSLIDNEDHLIYKGARDDIALTYDVQKEPTASSNKENSLPGSFREMASGYDADIHNSTGEHSSLPSFSGNDDIEPASSDSYFQNSVSVSLNLSYNNDIETSNSTGCPAATDYDGDSAESGTAATLSEDNTNTGCLPFASNTSGDIVPADGATDEHIPGCNGAAAPISSNNGAADIIITIDDVNTGPDGAPRRNPFQRIRKFFRRVKKRVVSIFK